MEAPAGDDDARARLRASDDERHAVAEVLREAAGAGRIDADELDERLEAAYAARTRADLDPLVADLPGHGLGGRSASSAAGPSALPATTGDGALVRRPDAWVERHPGGEPLRSRHLAMFGAVQRRGDWLVPASMTVVAHMGGGDLDLRRARFSAPEVVITAVAVMGGVNIVVPPDVDVLVEGTGIMGAFQGPSGDVESALVPRSPRVRVRGLAFWGGVNVERKPLDT